jgi:hypothetical protein
MASDAPAYRLYVVDVSTELLVWATSHGDAEALARTHCSDLLTDLAFSARPSRTPYGSYYRANLPPRSPVLAAPEWPDHITLSTAIALDSVNHPNGCSLPSPQVS